EQNRFLSLLPEHASIPLDLNNKQLLYWLLSVKDIPKEKNDKVWVPLIPGYTIFTFFAGAYFRLNLGWSQTYESHPDKFSSFYKYIQTKYNYTGKISVPYLLGLTCTENVMWLHSFIASHYDIFENTRTLFLADKKLNNIIKSGKRKADEIDKELANSTDSILFKARLPISSKGLDVDNRTIQAFTLQLEESNIELKNTRKKLRESLETINKLHKQLEEISNST
ncbi:16014_t:CDS:2, partial [Gigaspora rosea]